MLITIDIPRVKKIFNNKRNSSIKSLITEQLMFGTAPTEEYETKFMLFNRSLIKT